MTEVSDTHGLGRPGMGGGAQGHWVYGMLPLSGKHSGEFQNQHVLTSDNSINGQGRSQGPASSAPPTCFPKWPCHGDQGWGAGEITRAAEGHSLTG